MMSRRVDNPIVGHAKLFYDRDGQHFISVPVPPPTHANHLAGDFTAQVLVRIPTATSIGYTLNGQRKTFDLRNNSPDDEKKLYAFIEGVMTGREGCSNLITINKRTPEPLQVARAAFTDR